MALAWHSVKDAFEPDGAHRDLYVFDASIEDWQTLVGHVRRLHPVDFALDGEPSALPASLAELFRPGVARATRLLRIHRSADPLTDVYIHFFGPDEIEMDLDPRGVDDQASL